MAATNPGFPPPFIKELLMRCRFTLVLTVVVSFLLFVNLAETAQARISTDGRPAQLQAQIDEANRQNGNLAPHRRNRLGLYRERKTWTWR